MYMYAYIHACFVRFISLFIFFIEQSPTSATSKSPPKLKAAQALVLPVQEPLNLEVLKDLNFSGMESEKDELDD